MTRWRRAKTFPADMELLRQIDILAALPNAALETLMPDARWSIYGKGEEVEWEPDARGPLLFGVVQGCLRISFRCAEGRELPVTTIPSGGIFNPGEDGWAGVDETVSTAVARKNVICSLPRDAFTVAVDGCPLASRLLREYEGALIRELGGLTSDRLHRQPEVRIRHTLWRDTRDAPDRAAAYTHEELACRATTDRPRVTRVITKLIRDGIIEIEREEHRIIVRDPDRLAEHE